MQAKKEAVGYCKKQGCTTAEEVKKEGEVLSFWNQINDAKRLTVRKYSPEYPGEVSCFHRESGKNFK